MVRDNLAIAHHEERVHIGVSACADVAVEYRETILRQPGRHEPARKEYCGRQRDK